jgi:hypothetical protein
VEPRFAEQRLGKRWHASLAVARERNVRDDDHVLRPCCSEGTIAFIRSDGRWEACGQLKQVGSSMGSRVLVRSLARPPARPLARPPVCLRTRWQVMLLSANVSWVRLGCVLCVCLGCVLGVSWVCLGCVLGVSWVCLGCVLGVSWMCLGCVFGVSWVCLGCVLGVSWVCLGCVLLARVRCHLVRDAPFQIAISVWFL